MASKLIPTKEEVEHLVADAKAANEAWLSEGKASGPAELSMYVSNLTDTLLILNNERDE